MSKTIVVGLTGQTGAGKSTVCEVFRDRNIPVIDADIVARDVVDEGKKCLADLALEFSIEILNIDGTLNRDKFASIVFTDRNKLKKLNSIIFPYIVEEISDRIKEYRKTNEKLVILDAPTLFESGTDKFCDLVISVTAPETERLNRIIIRDRLTDTQARNRINAQHDEDFYSEHSDYVLNNASGLDSLKFKTLELMDIILNLN